MNVVKSKNPICARMYVSREDHKGSNARRMKMITRTEPWSSSQCKAETHQTHTCNSEPDSYPTVMGESESLAEKLQCN